MPCFDEFEDTPERKKAKAAYWLRAYARAIARGKSQYNAEACAWSCVWKKFP